MMRLNYKRPNRKKADDGFLKLIKNQPVLIAGQDSDLLYYIAESNENVDEILYIRSYLSEDEYALLGHESKTSVLKDPRAVDLMYLYFDDKKKEAGIFLYDMKKTLGGKEHILGLVSQLESSLTHAVNIISYLEEFQIKTVMTGVITENNNREYQKKEIEGLKKEEKYDNASHIPSFILKSQKAKKSATRNVLRVLDDFYEGRVFLKGEYYTVDVRMMIRSCA